MGTKPSVRLIALTLGLALVLLAGCGGDGAGDTAGGSEYEIALPSGWEDQSEQAEESEVPIRFDLVVGKERVQGFATNVNVLREPAPEGTGLEEIGPQFERQIEAFGARELSEPRDLMLDGDPAIARDYELSLQGRRLLGRQVFTIHDDRIYTVTFTSRQDSTRELEEFEQILDSWQWD